MPNDSPKWLVDERCIGCAAARHVAPGLIIERGGRSEFARQPQTEGEKRMAWLASELCPTRSVRSPLSEKRPEGLYPHELSPEVYLCGHNARSSYGAHSYFVRRPDGNLLIDSPVFTRILVQAFEQHGGISKIILSHKDDVADADKYASHFGSDVYIHRDERSAAPYATHLIDGVSPIDETTIGENLVVLPTPGHTKGSVMLLMDRHVLFTGDSLCWSLEDERLHAFRDVCWYSWAEQRRSLEALAQHDVERVFPGHGSWSPRVPADEMRSHLRNLLASMA
jgi:glyoxylase-like metal-dependent hydrolase (beta-lactamase superfamily II)